jgi:hypothetical protein
VSGALPVDQVSQQIFQEIERHAPGA